MTDAQDHQLLEVLKSQIQEAGGAPSDSGQRRSSILKALVTVGQLLDVDLEMSWYANKLSVYHIETPEAGIIGVDGFGQVLAGLLNRHRPLVKRGSGSMFSEGQVGAGDCVCLMSERNIMQMLSTAAEIFVSNQTRDSILNAVSQPVAKPEVRRTPRPRV